MKSIKTFHTVGVGAVLTLLSAGTWLACGDDTTGNNGTPGDAGGGSDGTMMMMTTDGGMGTPDSTMMNPDTGTTPDTGTGEGGGGGACATYCTAIMAACTGAYAQYSSTTECMTACALLPAGDAGDALGNSIACRTTHAGYAMTMDGGQNPHCWHAGPYGYGGCGTECESFCLLATTYCTTAGGFDGGPPPYASNADCKTACDTFARIDDVDGGGKFVDGGFNAAGPASGNTFDCREYHLGAALAGPGMTGGQELHCNHPGVDSGTCHN